MKKILVPKDKELVIVGDIHENKEHFDEMLIKAKVGQRILVSVGDIYNKGAGNNIGDAIVKKIMALNAMHLGYMVMGNNEYKLYKKGTHKSRELLWAMSCPKAILFQFHSGRLLLVVHAGVTPNHTWDNIENSVDVMLVRNVDEKGNPIPMIDGKVKAGTPWYEKYDGRFGFVMCGHDSQGDGEVKYHKHSCNLDTRCYETGVLAGQVVSDGVLKELILVKK